MPGCHFSDCPDTVYCQQGLKVNNYLQYSVSHSRYNVNIILMSSTWKIHNEHRITYCQQTHKVCESTTAFTLAYSCIYYTSLHLWLLWCSDTRFVWLAVSFNIMWVKVYCCSHFNSKYNSSCSLRGGIPFSNTVYDSILYFITIKNTERRQRTISDAVGFVRKSLSNVLFLYSIVF